MTEEEWQKCNEPEAMLAFCRDNAVSARKPRLLAAAHCRLVWGALTEWDRDTVEVAERHADGHASPEECLRLMYPMMGSPSDSTRLVFQVRTDWINARKLVEHFTKLYSPTAIDAALDVAVGLVRDIFGNPFRPVSFDAAWRTPTAVALAGQMYESRDFGAMPILADALQDAGCDSGDVLSHCRDPHATHVRGCWVVDLVLGKE